MVDDDDEDDGVDDTYVLLSTMGTLMSSSLSLSFDCGGVSTSDEKDLVVNGFGIDTFGYRPSIVCRLILVLNTTDD
jgi:hypothetical protein